MNIKDLELSHELSSAEQAAVTGGVASNEVLALMSGSTLLNEIGFNRDWIEKCLAHEDGRSSRSISSAYSRTLNTSWPTM